MKLSILPYLFLKNCKKLPFSPEASEWLSNSTTTVFVAWEECVLYWSVTAPNLPFPRKTPALGFAILTLRFRSLILLLSLMECVCELVVTLCLTVAKTSACLFLGAERKEGFVAEATLSKEVGHKNTWFHSMFHCMLRALPLKCFQKTVGTLQVPGLSEIFHNKEILSMKLW